MVSTIMIIITALTGGFRFMKFLFTIEKGLWGILKYIEEK